MNSNNSLVMPMKSYNTLSTHDFLRKKAIEQNNLNNSVGGAINVPSFNSVNPRSPYNATNSSISFNNTYAKAKTNSEYDHLAFSKGGKKSNKKHKKINKKSLKKKNNKKSLKKKNNKKSLKKKK
jgi:Flp pilus assembly CpaE family ATPase